MTNIEFSKCLQHVLLNECDCFYNSDRFEANMNRYKEQFYANNIKIQELINANEELKDKYMYLHRIRFGRETDNTFFVPKE